MNILKIIKFIFLCFWVNSLLAQTNVDLKKEIPIDPTVKIGKLANGLTYYLKQNSKPEGRAELRLIVKAGSILEDEDQLGLAHFVEHMAFNGTKNFKKNELIDYLQSIGIEFGADLNAYTSYDETVYMLSVPTDDQEKFNTSIRILRDWADGVVFSDDEIDNERGVVAEELRARSGAGIRMYYQSIPKITNNSRYAKRTPIGSLDVVMNSKYEALKRFYKDWYRPDLMALVLVGDFDVLETEKKIRTIFKDMKPADKNVKERIYYTIPDNINPAIAIISDPEMKSVNVNINYKKQKEKVINLNDYKTTILQTLYTGMLNQRLSDVELLPKAPFLMGKSYIIPFLGDKDSYFLRAILKENKINEGIEALLIESERARRHGFTESELERYKAKMLEEANLYRKETGKIFSGYYVNKYIQHFLNESPITSEEFNYEFYKDIFPSITIKEVNEVGKRWIQEKNMSVVINAPTKESLRLPNENDIIKMLEDVKTKTIDKYVDNLTNQELMTTSPKSGRVVETTYNEPVDATIWRFANGVTVIAKPTQLQNDVISMNGFRPGGSSVAPDSIYQSAFRAGNIIGKSGVNNISQSDLNKLNMGKYIYLSPSIRTYEEVISASSSLVELERMLQMVYLYFTKPNKDKAVFETSKEKLMAQAKNLNADPSSFFRAKILEVMTQNHLRGIYPTEDQIEKDLNLDKAYNFYKERFSSANGFTFIFVGNFKVEDIKQYAAQYLGSLPSNLNEQSTWKDIGLRSPERVIKKTFVKGIDNKSTVDMRFTGVFDFSLKEKNQVNLLAKLLRIKLNEEMREKMAGVYGANVKGLASDKPNNWYRMNIGFTCDPEKVEVLINKVHEEIDKIKLNGATPADLEKIKEAELTNLRDSQKYDSYWLNLFKNAIKYGLNPERMLDPEAAINRLTIEDFKKAANTYFDDNNYAEFILMPEKVKNAID